ncbi:MAG: ABC transporter ATP-binding protein [Deltaproteobacteria bacterium]|nr:ABC transporter ATP-binding protein [Deltaproteobacteria bacterium]
MLELKSVSINYGAVKAVHSASLVINRGELVALLGANGAGKTSIINSISGAIPISAGEIVFLNERINGLSPDRIASRGIIQVPEGRRIFPFLTVGENLMVGAYLQKDKKTTQKNLERVTNLFPILKEKFKQKGSELSGGQQQMLAFGRALMANPMVLMMDEPSLGLSPLLTQELGKQIREINREGMTILLVEQNARMGLTLSTKGYVLVNGQVAISGSSAELLNDDLVKEAYLGM